MSVTSLLIYLTVFVLSFLFAELTQYTLRQSNSQEKNHGVYKSITFVFLILSLAIPCGLAALRDTSVGKDVLLYVIPNFNYAERAADFFSFFNSMPMRTEVAFAMLIYFGGKLHNLSFLFFTIEFLIMAPVYYVLYQRRNQYSFGLGVIVFCFLFYNLSFSCMRQSISMAFMLLTYHFLRETHYIKSIITLLVAFLFHISAIIIAAIYLFLFVVNYSKYQKQIYSVLILVMGILLFNLEEVIYVIIPFMRRISGRYAHYIAKYLGVGVAYNIDDVAVADFLCKLVLILLILGMLVLTHKLTRESVDLLIMVLIGRIFALFNGFFYESQRIAYYFDYFLILYSSNILLCVKKDKINRSLASVLVAIIVITYWLYDYMYLGVYGTSKYMFR